MVPKIALSEGQIQTLGLIAKQAASRNYTIQEVDGSSLHQGTGHLWGLLYFSVPLGNYHENTLN
jgi:hypothetical protein